MRIGPGGSVAVVNDDVEGLFVELTANGTLSPGGGYDRSD